jgi:thymidylate synthase
MLVGTFEGIPDSWAFAVKFIMRQGWENNTEYGNKSKSTNGLVLELTNPKEDTWHPKDPFCNKDRIKEYKKQFVRGYKHGFQYTYLDRFTKYPKMCNSNLGVIDQLEFIQQQLKKGRFESRRLQAITWIPEIDAKEENEEPPCLQRLWCYAYPNKTLDVHINYRSWDIMKAYEANLNAILFLVREELLEPTGFKLNVFRALADNCHIYSEDYSDALRVV